MQWLLLILVIPYLILLLWIFSRLGKIKPFSPDKSRSQANVTITVITACRNEAGNISSLLKDLSRQDYPAGLTEFIIVDDNSTDGTFGIASQFRDLHNLRVLKNPGEGKKAAIKAGVDAASGELIVTTDADCRVKPVWLSTIGSFYNDFRPDMIICPVVIESSRGFGGKFQEIEFLSLQGVTAGTASGNESTMCNGANLAFRKEVFLRNGKNLHYELISGDDVFLLHSVKAEKGSKILFLESAGATVETAPAKSPGSFLRQRKRWLSKSGSYTDKFTVILGIVTFVTILSELSVLAAAVSEIKFLPVLLSMVIIKSVPDFLILNNTARRYGKRHLMRWFIPSQLVYPFYVLAVLLFPLKQH